MFHYFFSIITNKFNTTISFVSLNVKGPGFFSMAFLNRINCKHIIFFHISLIFVKRFNNSYFYVVWRKKMFIISWIMRKKRFLNKTCNACATALFRKKSLEICNCSFSSFWLKKMIHKFLAKISTWKACRHRPLKEGHLQGFFLTAIAGFPRWNVWLKMCETFFIFINLVNNRFEQLKMSKLFLLWTRNA